MRHRIRSAVAADAPAIAELLGQLGYPASVDEVVARLVRLLADDRICVVVAAGEERVLGLATLHVLPVLHEDSPRGQITALVVAGNVRGLGIGGSLVRHVEALAAARGVNGLVVTTANHREATHRFYERLGYEWTGRRYGRRMGTTDGR